MTANHDERATARVAPHHMTSNHDERATARVAPTTTSISNIIGAYKSLVFNACLEVHKRNNTKMGKLWQRNYYERIIRDDRAYQNIRQYIIDNPSNWGKDSLKQK
ncbi:transposase [Flavobacterium sp.]|uniref:transposase n=1 Tax=Flavobacterium sp. TaxID=239 RepID=UPI00260F393C|nr:transposase [Flavobacterium sp.]